MSVKIMGLVWDLDLPQNEKFVLLAYADHADHNGDNMFPAVSTVAKKTGYSERSIQRTTRTLVEKGYLVASGKGPKGTNKWKFGRGDILSGVTKETEGVTSETERGDIAVTPEPSLNHQLNHPLVGEEIFEAANKKMDAFLENEKVVQEKLSKNETYPHRDKFPEPIRELIDVYVKVTGQRPIKKNVSDWLMTGQDWLDLEIKPIDLQMAYDKSKPESGPGFTVARPGSLTNTAGMFAGERRSKGYDSSLSAVDRIIADLERTQ